MADPKMPPRDEKELERLKKMFQEGLEEAGKNPEKYWYIQRHQNQLIKPWERYLENWTPPKKGKEAAVRVASRFAAQADLEEIQDGLADLEALSDNLAEIEDAFDAHFSG